MRVVVVSFDSLALSLLGCYGNDWIETPQFDRLAAEAVVFDQHFSEELTPGAKGHTWWTGQYHFLDPDSAPPVNLLDRLSVADVPIQLCYESNARGAAIAGRVRSTEVTGQIGRSAEPHETPFARLVQAALPRLDADDWRLFWLSSAGVAAGDLAPAKFADFYADEQEAFDDANDLLAYAECVTLCDYWLGELLDRLDDFDEPPALIVTAGGGAALPSLSPQGAFGATDIGESTRLGEQTVHTPLIVRLGDGSCEGRRRDLVQTIDLAPTLLEAFGLSAAELPGESLLPVIRGERPVQRDRLFLGDDQVWGCRAPNFSFVIERSTLEQGSGGRLYFKPEDVWDVFDVAMQAPDLVDSLREELAQFVSARHRERK